jgi:hypothetical protein
MQAIERVNIPVMVMRHRQGPSIESQIEDSFLQEYDIASQGNRFPTFRGNVVASSSRVEMSKERRKIATWFYVTHPQLCVTEVLTFVLMTVQVFRDVTLRRLVNLVHTDTVQCA